jgi:hypothetical protein
MLSVGLAEVNRVMERPAPRAVARALTVGAVVGTVNDPEIGTGAGLITICVSLAAHGLGRRRRPEMGDPGIDGL